MNIHETYIALFCADTRYQYTTFPMRVQRIENAHLTVSDLIKHIFLHKLAMGLDTSYDNFISSSPYTLNGKHMRIQWCKHAYFITHFY